MTTGGTYDAGVSVEPRPAATVVLLRPGAGGMEVLLTLRPASMAFAGDLYVFPGGRVDEGDSDPRASVRSLEGGVAEVAAVRELFEEAGVLLAEPVLGGPLDEADAAAARRDLLEGSATIADVAERLDLQLRTDLLAPIGHWTTPPIMPRRFDTRFFAAELPAGATPTFTSDEVVEHRWLTPAAALGAMADGDIGMWVPTSTTLQQLRWAQDLAAIRSQIVPGPVAAPRVVVEEPAVTRIVMSGAGAVPGQTVNAYLVGRRELIVIDPGDPSDEAAEALLAAAAERGGTIVAIALTHVEPDHAAGAEGLALRLGIPIHAGPGAGRELPYEVHELRHGERLPAGDVAIDVIETPGPRQDHVAFACEGEVLITGDLVGPRADRSILPPRDAEAWAASLARLASRAPVRLLPGHGEPLGPDALRVAGEGQ
jgi:glyoxylase-like metal-dependent hydrolase (beta-lactamase superfamily II)/8-oxo-dGTP pyrophosphatase MutT (NUDIX family)